MACGRGPDGRGQETDAVSDETIKLMHGDCLDLMPLIPAGSVDMILTDLPA